MRRLGRSALRSVDHAVGGQRNPNNLKQSTRDLVSAWDEAQGARGYALGVHDATTQDDMEAKKRAVMDRMRGVKVSI